MSVIFVFLDGVGLGECEPCNPFWADPPPSLERVLGGPFLAELAQERPGLLFKALDATLGIAGVPQSATGQTALFTGINAPQLLGRHLPAYPNASLSSLLAENNILKRAMARGFRATFANPYSRTFLEKFVARGRRCSATTLSVLSSGLPFRSLSDLEEGRAVCWDITHKFLNGYAERPIPPIEPEEAGRNLALLAADYELVLYESFLTDLAGHRREEKLVREVLETVDRFLAGLLSWLSPEDTLVLTSDHGNIEDLSHRQHTRNPVPLLALGPGAGAFRQAQAITDVAGGIMAVLSNSY